MEPECPLPYSQQPANGPYPWNQINLVHSLIPFL
jgi:hypothetical protein